MARYCPSCGFTAPANSRFCPNCGAAFPVERPPLTWGFHPGFRFQVEPGDPPYRDARWVGLVVGTGLAVIGGFFLGVWSLVSGVTVPPPVLLYVFLIPGAACLSIGLVLVIVSLYRTLDPSHSTR
jgi:hypothetical protein